MKSEKVFLKPNVVIEPLVGKWYAWSHLISPATAAMNITDRHLKIINSYIQAPHIHHAAVKNPKMRGGPFMDLGGKYVCEVEQLKEYTLSAQKDSIVLSEAIRDLNKMLLDLGGGFSLEPLYEKIPETLKGYIELVYDLNNNPSFRFFESLLYKSRFYNSSYQSLALWVTNNDERPFVLSTPRLDLENDDCIHLDISFDNSVIDDLSRMKRLAGDFNQIAERLRVKACDGPLFRSFFTTQAPPRYQPYTGDHIRMRYFGHACIFIETKDVSILVDPLISYYGYHSAIDHFSDVDLPDKIDYVLITHNHQDHILFETLLPLRHKIGNIIVPRNLQGSLQDPSLKLMFNHLGFKNVIEIEDMQSLKFSDCEITGLPFIGEHGDLDIKSKICHHIRISRFSIIFFADSNILEDKLYRHIRDIVGDVDVLFLGMECEGAPLSWLYGPLMLGQVSRDKDITRRFSGSNFERAMPLMDIFSPKEVYVYAMGQEPWVEFISSIKYSENSHPIVASDNLISECHKRGIAAERLYGEKELLYKRTGAPWRP